MRDAPAVSILRNGAIQWEVLSSLGLRPALFETFSGGGLWDDLYISTQMLRSHLDPTTDAASRKPERIDTEVQWLVSRLGLRESTPVLDLGCGPGLYCTRLARYGLAVTGIDVSPTSIRYARETAAQQGLPITYRLQEEARSKIEGSTRRLCSSTVTSASSLMIDVTRCWSACTGRSVRAAPSTS
jgi:SAM-dependent methyltransferase